MLAWYIRELDGNDDWMEATCNIYKRELLIAPVYTCTILPGAARILNLMELSLVDECPFELLSFYVYLLKPAHPLGT